MNFLVLPRSYRRQYPPRASFTQRGLGVHAQLPPTTYPRTEVQLCIVHLVRAALNYVPWKLRKQAAADLQLIYRAATVAEAEQHLQELEAKWKAYPSVSQVWRRNWARITPFFHYPPDMPQGDLHHQQRGIAEPVDAQNYQNPRRIPQRRSGAEVVVSGAAAGGEEVDDADPSLARSLEPLYDSVARAHAGPGESYAMKTGAASKALGQGRGTAPFPGTPSPKTKPDRLHKRIDTPRMTRGSTFASACGGQYRLGRSVVESVADFYS